MSARRSVLEELEEALSTHAIAYRAETLRRITDLFLGAAADYDEREVGLFDDVMVRLVGEIESSVRAVLARKLATVPNAPRTLMRKLAGDEAIEVAGPVLTQSPRLDDATLVATATTASQGHLLAISQRSAISAAVTDVLVERGDREVALATVENAGAVFSTEGHRLLVERSKTDDALALGVWTRDDIPRHRLLELFTVATEKVRRSLEAADGQTTRMVRDMLSEVSAGFQSHIRTRSRDFSDAQRTVAAVHRAGRLDEHKVREYAATASFDETVVALALLAELPVGACERAMVQPRPELVILLARAIGFSWNTTRTVLRLRGALTTGAHDDCLAAFSKLKPETARKALQFLRLRERAAATGGKAGGGPRASAGAA